MFKTFRRFTSRPYGAERCTEDRSAWDKVGKAMDDASVAMDKAFKEMDKAFDNIKCSETHDGGWVVDVHNVRLRWDNKGDLVAVMRYVGPEKVMHTLWARKP